MPKIINSTRLTKEGLERVDSLLNSIYVHNQHKTLLKGIKDRAIKKNLSKADCDICETISNQYKGRLM